MRENQPFLTLIHLWKERTPTTATKSKWNKMGFVSFDQLNFLSGEEQNNLEQFKKLFHFRTRTSVVDKYRQIISAHTKQAHIDFIEWWRRLQQQQHSPRTMAWAIKSSTCSAAVRFIRYCVQKTQERLSMMTLSDRDIYRSPMPVVRAFQQEKYQWILFVTCGKHIC